MKKNNMKLIIVESPTKARTIARFVGNDFMVESSYGHVRDLPTSTLGIDLEHDYQPKYVTPRKAQPVIKKLREKAKKANEVILASDEDREGEAIAWHLADVLKLEHPKRIVFHEITESAITEALKHPRDLDMNLINAQQARRVLDRLVGYKLSPFLWKKVMRGLSAGRVQSVALRLIVERERERTAFLPQEYWSIKAVLESPKHNETFEAWLHAVDGTVLEKFAIGNETEATKLVARAEKKPWSIASVQKKTVKRNPAAPFTTSTLQQESSRRLKFSAKQTMYLAQQLYEGIELPEGSTGLITYMRTDSTNIAKEALSATETFVEKTFGKEYAVFGGRTYASGKRAQEAHEAIRPTDVTRTPESVKEHLERNQYRLYELIWQRFVSSQMTPATFEATTIDLTVDDMVFRSSGQILRFHGFLKVWPLSASDVLLPDLIEGDTITCREVQPEQHFTQPPARYSEATLIKTLEEHGIGRPSTYAPILSTIEERGYVTKDEKRKLAPTDIGYIVNDLLVEHFPNVVDLTFTATMEDSLDRVAEGEEAWAPLIAAFYEPFAVRLAEKLESVQKRDMTEPTGESCEKCGKPMVVKRGRFGKFIACSGFPECRNTKTMPPTSLGIPCPECGKGDLVERTTKKRRLFYGCSLYPDCKYATWKRPTREDAPSSPSSETVSVETTS